MKKAMYSELMDQFEGLIDGESDLIAGLANASAFLQSNLKHWWTGFYLVKHEQSREQLVLGPFQGPVACNRITKGQGVCGIAWDTRASIIVENVHEFEGHIACSAESNSEIVIPVMKNGDVVAVLDIDSKEFNAFDQTDQFFLESICKRLSLLF